jgi:hypothetical protein
VVGIAYLQIRFFSPIFNLKSTSMKFRFGIVPILLCFVACESREPVQKPSRSPLPIEGTWQLISGTTIQKTDTTVTDYTKNRKFLKIIHDGHFAFVGHDLNKGKDTLAFYSSGAGRYTLKDSLYTEHLEFCNDRAWEGNDFSFVIRIQQDSLVQEGIEKIEKLGVNRINIEKYIRLKSE